MKLLIYSHFFAPSVGGVETIVRSLACGLAALRDPQGTPRFKITLVTQTQAGNDDASTHPFRLLRRPGLLQLWRLIKESDVVHVAGPALAPLFLTRVLRKPLVIEHHGYQATCPNGLLFHHPSKTICPSHFTAGNYSECLHCNNKNEGASGSARLLISAFLRRSLSRGAAANIAPSGHVASRQALPRTTVIVHGVADPSRGTGTSPRNETINEKNFAYVGRLVPEKGVSVLLEATQLLRKEGREFHVTVIGDGPDRLRLENQIASSHLEKIVHISGFLSGAALEKELDRVGTIVIPTVMEETAGLAALEQMVRGRPVIASAIGGLEEIVSGAGLTFPPADSVGLAKAMTRILDEPTLAASLGASSRQRILQSFSLDGMIDAHARLYRELAAAAKS